MEKNRILVTDNVHEHLLNGLEALGYGVDYNPQISLSEVHDCIHIYYGIVINTKIRADRSLLEKASKLKFIARLGSGLDIIDMPFAQELNIRVISTPEGNAQSVAEHALGMLLSLLNKIQPADQLLRKFDWQREAHRGTELMGKHIGLVGFGHTGRAFARLLEPFDVILHIYDPYAQHLPENDRIVNHVELLNLIRQVDIISFHVQLTPETSHMVDKDLLMNMKKGMILINTSRGKVLDTEALIEALENGQVAAAGLDVFENEQTATFSEKESAMYAKLYQRNNVILTPHIAGWTHESRYKIADAILTKLKMGS